MPAVLWMLGAVASFIVMALSVRGLSGTLSIFQILFLRGIVGLPFLLAGILLWRGPAGLRLLRTGNLRLQVTRNAIHIVGQLSWIYGLTVLPLAMVFAVEFSAPLWSVLLGALVLREYPNRPQQIGVVLGLVGILIILRPGTAGFSWAVMAVLLAALAYAATYLITRMLGRTDSALAVLFWMAVLQSPVGFVLALTDWHPIPAGIVPVILLLGLSGTSAHLCLAAALKAAPLARMLPLDYLRLPVIAVIGAVFYGEPFDPFILAGGAVVLASVFLTQRVIRHPPDQG